jgi:hypothetical protein
MAPQHSCHDCYFDRAVCIKEWLHIGVNGVFAGDKMPCCGAANANWVGRLEGYNWRRSSGFFGTTIDNVALCGE